MAQKNQTIETLVQEAVGLQRAQRLDEAEALYRRILERDPIQPMALQFMSGRCFQRGDMSGVIKFLTHYLALDPSNLDALHALATAYEALERIADAIGIYRQALSRSPHNPKTLLFLGAALALRGEQEAAAAAASLLETTAPEMLEHDKTGSWDATIQKRSKRVREALENFRNKLRHNAIATVLRDFPGSDLGRVLASRWRPVFDTQDDDLRRPSFFYVPNLGHAPWIDASRFAWAAELESTAPALLKEVTEVLDLDSDGVPYIEESLGKSETWNSLAGKKVWSALHFWDDALPKEQTLKRFPKTRAALEKLPLVEFAGTPMEAFLSVLKPNTLIPPHYGIANYRLTVHLPLIVPKECGVEVAGAARETKFGQLMAFDDSYDHKAWNNSDSARVVLIFEVWHPALSHAERNALALMLECYEVFSRNRRAMITGSMGADGCTDEISPLVRVVSKNPKSAQTWLELVKALKQAGREDEAIQAASLGCERSDELQACLTGTEGEGRNHQLARAAERMVHNKMETLHQLAIGQCKSEKVRNWPLSNRDTTKLNDEECTAIERSILVRHRWMEARSLPPVETIVDRTGKPVSGSY